ncbi:MAG TPA: hypothetical protein VHU81_03425 [Thermoanaerobaculia bacterium]|jgi:hypothetical protein|nr:hypothetical protein [Thermoanaerobaculia bacterium]
MNLENLSKDAVRSTARTEKVAGLSERELKTVVGGIAIVGDDTPQRPVPETGTVREPVTPEQCAIHFYYPSDGAL